MQCPLILFIFLNSRHLVNRNACTTPYWLYWLRIGLSTRILKVIHNIIVECLFFEMTLDNLTLCFRFLISFTMRRMTLRQTDEWLVWFLLFNSKVLVLPLFRNLVIIRVEFKFICFKAYFIKEGVESLEIHFIDILLLYPFS